MNSATCLKPRANVHKSWVQRLIAVIVVVGLFWRFYNIETKFYWHDEACTSLRNAGYTTTEVVDRAFTGHAIAPAALQQYLKINPDRDILDAIESTAAENAHHVPLYFFLARIWTQIFGDSTIPIRSLSVLISLFAFPCIYWLCWELFHAASVGWIAVGLLAISPFHVLYAQEARPYSLWIVTLLLSSIFLLRGIKRNKKWDWVLYSVTTIASFYTFLFSLLVAVGHGIYLLFVERFQWTRTVRAYLLASAIAILAFLPWMVIIIKTYAKVEAATEWLEKSKRDLVGSLIINSTRIFFDINYLGQGLTGNLRTKVGSVGLYLIFGALLILIGYAFYFLWRYGSRRSALFIFTLGGTPLITLLAADLILGGQRSTVTRYLIPFYLAIEIAVAYLLATQMTSRAIAVSQQKRWGFILVLLVCLGIVSCAVSAPAENWWNKPANGYTPQVARIVNATPHPLLIAQGSTIVSKGYTCSVLALSRLLDSNVNLLLVKESNIPQIPQGYSDIFLFNPSDELIQGLEKQYAIEPVYKRGKLYQVVQQK